MKIGDRIMRIQSVNDQSKYRPDTVEYTPRPCTIVYIHPKRRFYIVEFDDGFRESYLLREDRQNG